jgi:hypothetical protein
VHLPVKKFEEAGDKDVGSAESEMEAGTTSQRLRVTSLLIISLSILSVAKVVSKISERG